MSAEVVVASLAALTERFTRLTASTAREAIGARGTFSLAVPGGSATERLLPALDPSSIDGSKTEVFWVDERMVPPDDPSSNFRLAKTWLDRAGIPEDRIHRMPGEASDPEAAASSYERLVPARIDLVLLGMGEDGHVASLFPGHRLLRERARLVAVLDDAPKPPPRRMTLTLTALHDARSIVVYATGPAKAHAIASALHDPDSELPVALATMGRDRVTYLLDPAASGEAA